MLRHYGNVTTSNKNMCLYVVNIMFSLYEVCIVIVYIFVLKP